MALPEPKEALLHRLQGVFRRNRRSSAEGGVAQPRMKPEASISEREKIPIVERKEGEIKPEVKDYITKVETAAEIDLPQPITDDQGQVVADDVTPKKVVIKLPLTEAEMKRGLHYKIIDSLRWLAEWCLRLVKIAHGKFIYRGAER